MKVEVADNIREFQNQTLKYQVVLLEEKASVINKNNAHVLDKLTANGHRIMDLMQEVRQELIMTCPDRSASE